MLDGHQVTSADAVFYMSTDRCLIKIKFYKSNHI